MSLMATDTFQTLSNQLPPGERKVLLEKIYQSINLEQKDSDSIITIASPKEEMESRLRTEILALGFWSRLLLRLKRFFTGKSEGALFFQKKMQKLKNSVNHSMNNVVIWERMSLTEKFARRIYDLLFLVNDLKPLFKALFKEEGPMGPLITVLLESRIPEVKKEIFDVLSKNEMETIYKSTGEKEALKKKLHQNLEHYLNNIPLEVIREVKELLAPFYFLKHLVLFPYALVLDLFGHNPGDLPLQKYPTFRESLLKNNIEFLERMYFALYMCQKIDFSQSQMEQVFNKLDRLDQSIIPMEGIKKIKELLEEAKDVFFEIPFLGIIRAYHEDPYFKLKFHVPEFRLREFYKSALILVFNNNLEVFFPRLRQQIIDSQKESLFQEQNAVYLENYAHHHQLPLAQYGLRSFSHVESLNLLYSFLKNHLPVQITPLIQTVSRVLLQNDKRLLTRILASNQVLDEIRQRIENLDIKIGPLGEEGEIFKQLVSELEEKPTSHKLFKSFVEKQDSEARILLKEAREKLYLLKTILEEISSTSKPSQKKILTLPFLQGGQGGNLGDALAYRAKTLGEFILLLKETLDMENDAS